MSWERRAERRAGSKSPPAAGTKRSCHPFTNLFRQDRIALLLRSGARILPYGIFAFLGMLVACTNPFSPPEISGSGVSPIRQQTSVRAVLDNFRYAYENRDIDVYENLLDPDFVFSYFDPERIEGIDRVLVPRDGPSGDVERTRRMFAVFDDIRLPTWDSIAAYVDTTMSYPREVRRMAFRLVVRDLDGDYGYEAIEANGDALFFFRQTPQDGLWRIVRWDDVSNQ